MDTIQRICEALGDYDRSEKETEYRSCENAYCSAVEALFETLSQEQKRLFFRLEADRNLMAAMDEDRMFRSGFQQGAKLILKLLEL